jgi:hypothetical protein
MTGMKGIVVRGLLQRAAVLGTGLAVVAVAALPDPSRAVLVVAGFALAACVAAAATRRQVAGTLALAGATLTVLLAGALDTSAVRPAQVVVGAGLLMALLSALAAGEEARAATPAAATVARTRWPQRLAAVLLATAAGAIVAVTGAQDVVPSVPLVLAGLTAAVAAFVIAASGHRTGRR